MLKSASRVNKIIGQNIRNARSGDPDKNITQEELANRIKLSRISVVNIEKGRQGLTMLTLINISKALDVPVSHLIKGL